MIIFNNKDENSWSLRRSPALILLTVMCEVRADIYIILLVAKDLNVTEFLIFSSTSKVKWGAWTEF